jgi:hypothetical protein
MGRISVSICEDAVGGVDGLDGGAVEDAEALKTAMLANQE